MHERQYELLKHQMRQTQQRRVKAPSKPSQSSNPLSLGKWKKRFTSRFVVPMTATPESLISSHREEEYKTKVIDKLRTYRDYLVSTITHLKKQSNLLSVKFVDDQRKCTLNLEALRHLTQFDLVSDLSES